MSSVLNAGLQVKLVRKRTAEAANELEVAYWRVMFASLIASDAAEEAEAAVDAAAENVVDLTSQAVIKSQAEAVRARI